MNSYRIVTIPRTGAHLLKFLIGQNFEITIPRTHDTDKPTKDIIISTAREPKDFTVSDLAMVLHYSKNDHTKSIEDLVTTLYAMTDIFIKKLEYLIDYSSIVLKYDDLTNNPEGVVNYLSKNFDLPIIKKSYPIITDKPEYNHLVSSKTSKFYKKASEAASYVDFSEINKVYASFLSMAAEIKPTNSF